MSYIGNTSTTQAFTPAVDYFSGNASTTAFTLSRPVASVAQVQVVVNNVAQNPSSAYTISSNTITFTSAPSSGTNNIYVYYTSPITDVIAPGQNTVTTTSLAGGTVTTTADATLNGLTVGKGGGAVSTNTAVGASALAANTTGTNNTVLGINSGLSSTTATNNVYLGLNSGYWQTTGGFNVAVGASSFQGASGNATGSYNSAFGYYALIGNTTGTNNVALGSQALQANTTASQNTAVGYQALYTNVTGAQSTAVGYQAGYTANAGPNDYFGYLAGYTNSTGTTNVCIGTISGRYATGGNNTFLGYNSGGAITTGAKNTIIGQYSGNQGSLDIRTSSNYIVLSDGDGNPRGIFTNNGFLCIGGATTTVYSESLRINTANNQGIHINETTSSSSINYQYFTKGAGPTNVGAIYYNGSVMAYQTTSDYRLKENVAPISNALNKINLLKPVTYTWIDNQQSGEGFIAHELQEHFPDAVSGTKDEVDENGKPKYQGMDASVLIATLTAAIQELKAINDTQAETINALTARIEALENK